MAFEDVVVLIPGITGSVLSNAKGKEVWSPTVGAIWRAISSGGRTIDDLVLASDGDPGGITAPRLIPDVTIVPGLVKIDGYTRIERHFVDRFGLTPGKNYFPFPYDWRLDNAVTARRLAAQAMDWLKQWRTQSPHAKLVLVGHSMGGLIARYFIECLGGFEDTRALITLGTPHQGSLNAVDFIEHGMKKGIGPFGLDLSPLLRSFTSVYQLLPIYSCIETTSGLSKVTDAATRKELRMVDAARAAQARAFHQAIEDAQKQNTRGGDSHYRLIPVVGIDQPTYQSALVRDGEVHMRRSLNGADDGGDGTVPRLSATPIELEGKSLEIFAPEMHGSLQNGSTSLANLTGKLVEPQTRLSRLRDASDSALTLDVEDVVAAGESLLVRARAVQGNPFIQAEVTDTASGATVTQRLSRDGTTGWVKGEFDLTPGVHRVRISVENGAQPPVTDLVVAAAP